MVLQNNKIPDILIEQLALGELLPEKRAELLRQFDESRRMERLDSIHRSNEEILRDYPPAQMARAIERRYQAAKSPKVNRRFFVAVPALASAAAAAILIWMVFPGALPQVSKKPELGTALESPGTETVRIKGESRLFVHRKIGDHAERLTDGAAVESGDVLQLSYLAAGVRYGAIFSVDGRGAVTLHFPKTASDPTELKTGGQQPLPYSYELDDAPEFERFFFVTSKNPFDVESVLKKARLLSNGHARLELPKGLRQTDLIVKKSSPSKSEASQ